MHPTLPLRLSLRRRLLTLTVFTSFVFSGLTASASTTPVFSDNFEDGNRTGWYNSAAGSGVVVSGVTDTHKLNNNALRALNSAARGLTYFDSTTLGVGDSLSVSFNLSFASISSGGGNFIIQMLNSSGNPKVTGDSFGSFDFTGYQGYRLRTNTGAATSGSTTIEKRDSSSSSFDGTSIALTGSANGVNLTASTAYSVSITFVRTGLSSLETTYSLNGVSLVLTDTAATNFTFDTLSYYKGNTNGDLYLDDVLISHTSSIPEPSTAALLSGLAIGVLAVAGRRRRC